jgi:hypothetical protein
VPGQQHHETEGLLCLKASRPVLLWRMGWWRMRPLLQGRHMPHCLPCHDWSHVR